MNRRTLLTRIVQGFAGTGVLFFFYPFVKAWLPSFDQDLSLEVPLDDLAPGESKVVDWLGRRVFVQRRTPEMIANLTRTDLPLKDPTSSESEQPAFAVNPWRSRNQEIFVAFNNCTHLGCEVVPDNQQGFICPCHQSDYDFAGRVLEGAAAPTNLAVPLYRFASRNLLVLQDEAGEVGT
ncbi:MAG: ubiquinol-cytochrome c reductase iron-sulfur subunit [Pseudomonadota bacterium]